MNETWYWLILVTLAATFAVIVFLQNVRPR